MKFKRNLPYSVDDVLQAKLNIDSEFVALVTDLKKMIEKGPVVSGTVTRESKIFFAYLEKDLNTMHQYMIIVKQIISAPQQPRKTVYAITPVIRYGDLCLEKYFLAKGDGLLNTYFKDFFDQPIVLPAGAFESFIVDHCKMEFSPTAKNSPKYWKKPENAKEILKQFEDLGKINFSVLRKGK